MSSPSPLVLVYDITVAGYLGTNPDQRFVLADESNITSELKNKFPPFEISNYHRKLFRN